MRHVWLITFCLLVLSILSLFNILSLSVQPDGSLELSELFIRHFIYIVFGWIVYIFLSKLDYSIIKYLQFNVLLYFLTIFFLLATILWGPVINNTQRWLIIADFQFQPSELAKLTMIFFTGYLFTLRDKVKESILFLISLFLLIPILIIVYLQPHGSMSLILLLIWSLLFFAVMKEQLKNFLLLVTMFAACLTVLAFSFYAYNYAIIAFSVLTVIFIFIYYARENWRKILSISALCGLILGLVFSVSWHLILLDYQKERINAFFNPIETSQDLGFNVDQSRVAIGSGEIFGKGWGLGTQSKLQFLPEYQTDFIFASFSEEFGLIGSLTLIIIYAILIFTALYYAYKSSDMNFEFVVLTGIAIKIFLEVFINIGTNTGIIPATGIPLPIMSVGGTSILFFFFSLGIVQSIIVNNANKYTDIKYSCVDNDDSLI